MNVIGARPTGWWRDVGAAFIDLLSRLEEHAHTTGDEVTLVLEGRFETVLTEANHDGVSVVHARRRGRDAADDRIMEIVAADAKPGTLIVVTSDRVLRMRVEQLGASAIGATAFLARLGAQTSTGTGEIA
ncbi:MAG: RNA-binding protein [Dehalococcoidia bacterium]|nr:RNA-binding protein [Dehalococcoidia bacterium]